MPRPHALLSLYLGLAFASACGSAEVVGPPPPDWELPVPAQDGMCPPSRTLCGDQCVDPRDPEFGCGSCTPCALPRARAKCEAAGPLFACSIARCEAGFENCNRFPSDGCEVELATDANHCGACGTVCAASEPFVAVCEAAVCGTACAPETNLCGGACVPDSPAACGASCAVCSAPAHGVPVCAEGACDFTCEPGFTRCATGCCSACGDTAGLQAGAPWPTEARCPTRVGRAGATAAATLSLKWSFRGWPGASPAIAADGTLYFVSLREPAVYALAPDGTLQWRAEVGATGFSTPTIGADGKIHVALNASGASNGRLVALSPAGALAWSVELGERVGSPLIAGDGTVYVGYLERLRTGDRLPRLAAVSPDGRLRWTVALAGAGSLAPFAPRVALGNDGTVYATGRRLYAVSPAGEVKWSYPGADVSWLGGPVVTPGDAVSLVISNDNAHVFARVDGLGAETWRVQGPTVLDAALPVVSGTGRLFVTGGQMSSGHRVLEFQSTGFTAVAGPTTGSGAGNAIGNPVIDGADALLVYTMSRSSRGTEHRLHTVDASGSRSVPVPALEKLQPSIGADGTVYAVGVDGDLFAFGE